MSPALPSPELGLVSWGRQGSIHEGRELTAGDRREELREEHFREAHFAVDLWALSNTDSLLNKDSRWRCLP